MTNAAEHPPECTCERLVQLKADLGPDYDILNIAIPLNVSREIDADKVAAMVADMARGMIAARG